MVMDTGRKGCDVNSDPHTAASRRIADKYIPRDGGAQAPTPQPRARAFDRQHALSLISDTEADIKARKYARAKLSLKLLRKLIWEGKT